jgi:ABC-type Fe3+ transport system permease subunit
LQEYQMKFTAGTIVTIVVVMLFYLRLIILQRQKVKVAKLQYSAAEKARSKKKNHGEPLEVHWGVLGVSVRNWWLMGTGIALVAFGAIIVGTQFLSPELNAAWWVPLNVGIGLMAMGVK